MNQHELHPAPGSRHKPKRVGRGDGSGHGTYSGRGLKGQKARSGGGVRPGFEGGQLPLIKRLPRKRGFTPIFRTQYAEVNVGRLNEFSAETEVTPQLLWQAGLVKPRNRPVKILGEGELRRPLSVTAHRFSASAKRKIEAAGGKTQELGYEKPAQ